VSRAASAKETRPSCPRATPRADSSAFSSSRWVASNRAASAAAAVASRISCSEPISSRDLATTRLLPSADRVCGNVVAACRLLRSCRVCRDSISLPSRAPSAAVSLGAMLAVSTVTSQDAWPVVSLPGPSAAGATSMGP